MIFLQRTGMKFHAGSYFSNVKKTIDKQEFFCYSINATYLNITVSGLRQVKAQALFIIS